LNPKKVKVRFYKTLGFQFKCFLEIDVERLSSKLIERLTTFLKENGYEDVSLGKRELIVDYLFGMKRKRVRRIWFIHNDKQLYWTVKTKEGIVNNMYYPA